MTDALDTMAQDLEALRRERDEWKARFEGETEVCSLCRDERDALRDELNDSEKEGCAADDEVRELLEALAAERERADGLARDLQEERYHRQAVERSEQSLAAHMEEVHSAYLSGGEWADRILSIGRVLNQSPTTSLAHRDARMKAEALEEAVTLYGHEWDEEFAEVVTDIMRKGRGFVYPEGLLERADEYRHQAEGENHE